MGCSKDTTITIGTYTPTVFVGDIQHVTCNGVINGAVDITIVEGNPDYSYMWENGMTTEDITDLTSGTYRVTITDGNGCTVWGSFNVMEPQALTAEIVTTQPTNVVDVDIDLTVLGGTAPYFYTWNTGDVSEDLYNVTAGYYEATVIDYNGCEVMVDQVVEEVSIASIESLESIDIDIYPNPTSDYANISWQNNDMNTVAIINANGKIIEKSDVSLQSSFRTKNLKSGLYFIHLKDIHDNTYIGKLIAE